MNTEWWNEPEMSEDERALEKREHQFALFLRSAAIPSI